MLAGRSLAEVLRAVEDGCSPMEKMQAAAKAFGFSFHYEPVDLVTHAPPPTSGAILVEMQTHWGPVFKHWVAWDGTKVLDPKFGIRGTVKRKQNEDVLSAKFYQFIEQVAHAPEK
jgi:hypothetical protein